MITRISRKPATRLCVVLLLAFLSFRACASGVQIGVFCIDGVKQSVIAPSSDERAGGHWHDVQYSFVRGTGSAPARLSIFDRQIPEATAYETCEQVVARMKNLGAQLLLSGRLNSLKLSGHVFSGAQGGNRFQIDAHKMDVEMGMVDSGTRTIAGGTLDLRGSKLWVTNPEPVLVTDHLIQGKLQIEAWNRHIVGFKLAFHEGLAYGMELAPVNPDKDNVTIRVDLSDNATSLWQANLTGKPVALDSMDHGASFGPLVLSEAAIIIANADLRVSAGNAQATARTLSGTARVATVSGSTFDEHVNAPTFDAKSATGAVAITELGSVLGPTELAGLNLTSEKAEILTKEGRVILDGELSAKFFSLSTEALAGSSIWKSPHLPDLQFLLPPDTIDEASVDVAGKIGDSKLSGVISTKAISISSIEVTAPLKIPFTIPSISPTVHIPLVVDVGPRSSSLQVHGSQGEVKLQAAIKALHLAADLALQFPDLFQSKLLIAEGGLRAGLRAAVALTPFVADVKPELGSGDIAIANFGPLAVGRNSTGYVSLKTSAFIIANPRIKVGNSGKGSHFVNLSLEAQGGATLLHNLADDTTPVVVANIEAHNISASMDDAVLDLDGVQVSAPAISIELLSVKLDQLGQKKYQEGHLKTLSITATHVTKPFDPNKPTEVSYSAVPTEAVTVEELKAQKLSIADNVAFEENDLQTLDIGLDQANVDFSGGIKVSEATMTLHLGRATQSFVDSKPVVTLTDAKFKFNGNLAVAGDVSINGKVGVRAALNVAGETDKLTGGGTVGIDAFTGSAQSQVKIAFDCKNTHELDVPMEYNFGISAVDLAAAMDHGHFSADASVGPLVLAVHTKSGAECDDKDKKIIIAPATEGWTYGVCSKGLEFYRCEWHWSTPEINIIYHIHLAVRFAAGAVGFTNPRIRLESDKINVCNLGAMHMAGPFIVGGYSPNIVTNYPDASNLINGIIDTAFEPVETAAVNALTTGGSWLFNTLSPFGNLLCIR